MPEEAVDFTYLEDRLPPCSLDAEEAIVGGVLVDPNAIGRVRHQLDPKDFYSPPYRAIYQAACELYDEGEECNLFSVTVRLGDTGRLERVGGKNAIANLMEVTVGAVNIDFLAELVAGKAKLRRLIEIGREIQRLGHQKSDYREAINSAEQLLSALSLASVQRNASLLSEIAIPVAERLEQLQQGAVAQGIPTGFYDLDALTQGLQPGELWVVGGRPSMGKTALCIQIARNVAEVSNRPTLIFSLETPKESLFKRLLSGEAQIAGDALNSGRVDDWSAVWGGIARLSCLPVYVDDSFDHTIDSIRSRSRKLSAETGGLGCIVIDYLQIIADESENRVSSLSRATRALKSLARELETTILCLSQLSRGVESRNNKRPMMSDLRESGGIEQDADLVALLYRDDYYNPETRDRGIAEVIIAKHRNGPIGTAKLLFEPNFTRFRNLKSFG